ncbi:unnamed protein product [Camellia sinensis]
MGYLLFSFAFSLSASVFVPVCVAKLVNTICCEPSFVLVFEFGTNVGDISIWEVRSRERLAHKPFKVWDLSACSMPLQTALVKDATISINRCIWGPDGSMLVLLSQEHCSDMYLQSSRRIKTTFGSSIYLKAMKLLYILFFFSTAIDGKIKAWLYDCLESRVDYDAPGLWCTAMAYSADGTRANMMRIIGLERDTISDSHLRMSRLESRNAWKKELRSSFWKKFSLDSKVNLIINDYCMPGMSGYELLKKVK